MSSETEASAPLVALAADVAALKKDMDQILPSLVDALKRNRYFDEMERQLRRTEKVSEAWREWPLITGVHDVVLAMRAAPESDPAMVEQLVDVLYRAAGVEEFGHADEPIEPDYAEITSMTGEGSHLVVVDTQRPGLRVGHHPLRKAIVAVRREQGAAR